MKCSICTFGDTVSKTITVPLQRGEHTVVFKNVKAQVCDNCGDYYLDEATAQTLLEQAKSAVARGVEVEIIRLAA